jgi:hypothetical protein
MGSDCCGVSEGQREVEAYNQQAYQHGLANDARNEAARFALQLMLRHEFTDHNMKVRQLCKKYNLKQKYVLSLLGSK